MDDFQRPSLMEHLILRNQDDFLIYSMVSRMNGTILVFFAGTVPNRFRQIQRSSRFQGTPRARLWRYHAGKPVIPWCCSFGSRDF